MIGSQDHSTRIQVYMFLGGNRY